MNNEIEINAFLMKYAGSCPKGDDHERPIITTVTFGRYEEPSSVMLEVQGSPVRGRALVTFRLPPRRFEEDAGAKYGDHCWWNAKVYLFDNQGAVKRSPRHYKITRMIVQHAEAAAIQAYEDQCQQCHGSHTHATLRIAVSAFFQSLSKLLKP
tara:strand:+ start:75 stop:533 length:459 start_codon:yes stop_codon:yes gene_type:complete